MNYKEQLQELFKKFEAAPFLFIGSGISKRYLKTESWEALIKKFCDLIGENFTKLKSQADGDYQKMASLLVEIYSDKWWESSIKGDKDEVYSTSLIKKDSPLKIEISNYLNSAHQAKIDESHIEEIKLLETSKVDGIITTNWDLFLESLFPKFTKYIGQDGLIASRSHGVAEIYKIHGCCSAPNSLVLTGEDYVEFRRKNPYLSSKLLTLFIEHPIIFLGYSLSDPHILEILEEIVRCFPEKELESLRNNLFFVEWVPDIYSPVITESILFKTLPVKLIRTSNYIDLFDVLSQLKRRVPAHVLRLIKDELYDLVITNDPKGQLYVRDAADLPEDDSFKEFVVGFGAISKIKKSEELAKHGIVGIERYDIVRDVLFNNGGYDPKTILFEAIPNLIKGGSNVPIFKYINEANLILDDATIQTNGMCKILLEKIKINESKFRSKGGESKRAESIPELQQGISELYEATDFNLFLRMAPFIPKERINLDDYLAILKQHIDYEFDSAHKSQFIKLVCLYDYYKYAPKKLN